MRLRFCVTCLFLIVFAGCSTIAQRPWGVHRHLWQTPSDVGCEEPAENCFDDVVVTPHASALRTFNHAVENGSTSDYFSGNEWRALFPGLEKFPKQLELLRAGLPLLRIESSPNVTRYLATRLTLEQLKAQAREGKRVSVAGVVFCLTVRSE
jgi:hypothetical protein